MNELLNINNDKNKFKQPIPKPSELKISTMTIITNINGIHQTKGIQEYNIDLDILSRFIDVYPENSEQTNNMIGGIVGIDYFSNISRGISKKTSPFYNQSTVIYHYWGFRSINIKIFNNGKLQMTGLCNDGEANYVTKFIINQFKNTKIKIYKNLLDLPCNKLNDFNIVYNPKTDKYNYYRYNYINNYDNNIIKYNKTEQLNGWVSDTFIHEFLVYLYNTIKSDKEKYNICATDIDLKNKILYMDSIYKRLTKIRTKDIEVTKNIINNNKNNLVDNDINTDEVYWTFPIFDDTLEYKLGNKKIELINSNFTTNYSINNTILHQLLNTKYKIFSSYEPNDYPGVKNKFYWNNNKTIQDGICNCDIPCVSLGKRSKCTQITISIFQSGSIIITGAKSIPQIKHAYSFINKLLKEEFDLVYIHKTINNNEYKTNEMRKVLRKKRLFYIKKSDIINSS